MKFFLKVENHKMISKKILYLGFIVLLLGLNSCQSVKDAVTGKKAENSDEFLIKKKNPLVLPPNFDDLPEPTDEEESEEDDTNIQEMIGMYEDEENLESLNSSETTEQFVLDNINND